MKDYYYILGISQNATIDEIKKAYRKLSLKFHPDKNDGDEFFSVRFKEIQEAYEILREDYKRSSYDSQRNLFYASHIKNVDIEYFRSNKIEFSLEEILILSWSTQNADKVYLKSFGFVSISGTKTIKIKNSNKQNLTFELIAENSESGQIVSKKLNLKYKDLHNENNPDNPRPAINLERKIFGFSRLIFINAILKPLIVFGIIFLITYFLSHL